MIVKQRKEMNKCISLSNGLINDKEDISGFKTCQRNINIIMINTEIQPVKVFERLMCSNKPSVSIFTYRWAVSLHFAIVLKASSYIITSFALDVCQNLPCN